MMQDDPDPDAIASALALRTLLGRTKTAAPIATFGTITRPENRAMTPDPRDRRRADRAAATSPTTTGSPWSTPSPRSSRSALGEVDLVIDHHPEEQPVARAPASDVRPSYGATSTILTEYLRAADVKIRERLATALLYGIKADTLHLERGATRADMEAFAFLHAHANHNALRRIERPDLPEAALDVLAQGIAGGALVDGVMLRRTWARSAIRSWSPSSPTSCCRSRAPSGRSSPAAWTASCTSRCATWATCGRAGDVMRDAFGELGSAGGHRVDGQGRGAAARLAGGGLPTAENEVGETIAARFLAALRGGRELVGGRDRPPHRIHQGRARRAAARSA